MTTSSPGIEAQLAHMAQRDFRGYSKHCLRIKDKDGKIVPLSLNEPQGIVLAEILRLQRERKPIRLIILKARQEGISTFSQAWLAHKAFTHQGQNCLTIAQNLDMAGELFGKIEMMYSLLPEWAKPKKDSRTRGKRLALAEPLHSLLYVDSAENRDAGRSGTFMHVHATEIPLWPDAKRTMDGLLQSVPYKAGTSIIVESTAKGMGDYFHKMWKQALAGENGFTPIFLPWHAMETYERDTVASDLPLDPFQLEMKQAYDLSDRKVVWIKDKLRELQGDRDMLAQEYPSTPDEAFLASGRPFFHRNTIKHYRDNVEEPLYKGDYRLVNGRPRWVDDEYGPLWIWETPQRGSSYVLAADIATGRAADYSTMQLLRGSVQVASYRAKVEPDELAQKLGWVGKVFNRALVVPERNGVGLATVLKLVNDIGYSNLYTHKRLDTTTGSTSVDYGWTTTQRTRPAMLEELAALARSGELIVRDSRTVHEMETFVFSDELGLRAEANPGSNDDLIMALAIGLAVTEYYGDGQVYYEQDLSHDILGEI